MARPPRRVTSLFTPGAPRNLGASETGPVGSPPPSDLGENVRSVSQVVAQIKRTLEGQVGRVTLVGELSSFRAWRSGHWYFDLKDSNAILPGVMFKGSNRNVRFEPEDGMQVLVTGRVSLYEAQSKAQLVVEKMEPVGAGALALAFEQLKEKLAKEGLFEADRKKSLPFMPRRVGVVTSPQGAALQDIIRILRQRMPGISVLLSPTRVQGKGSANEIAQALAQLDATDLCDVIVVGRGGGSLEDLWAFNEEPVARAIAQCNTPVISAVGHETDVTIADWVADLRVATPSHAAQAAVPDLAELQDRLAQLKKRLDHQVAKQLDVQQKIDHLAFRLDQAQQRRQMLAAANLSRLSEQLSAQAPRQQMKRRRQRVQSLSERLMAAGPRLGLERAHARLEESHRRLDVAATRGVEDQRAKVAHLAGALHAMSPLAVLGRGYAVVSDKDGDKDRVITRAAQVGAGQPLKGRMQDGEIHAQCTRVDLNGQMPDAPGEDS